MIENYQEEKQLEEEQAEPEDQHFATVGAVYTDGLTLKFDGTSAATTKRYKCNTFYKFVAGDRVHIMKDSGTYVVICAIGAPATSINADTVTKAKALDTSWSSAAEVPTVYLSYSGYELDYSIDGQTIFAAANKPRDMSAKQYDIQFRTDSSGYLEYKPSRFGSTWYRLARG